MSKARYEKLEQEEKELEEAITKAQTEEVPKEEEKQDEGFKEDIATEVIPDQTEPAAEKQELPLKTEKENEDSQTWKQKYSTIEGKYKAEVPRLNQDVKQWKDHAVSLNGRIADLEKTLDELKHNTVSTEVDKGLEGLIKEYPDIGTVIKKINDDHRAEIQALEKKFTKGMETEINSVKSDINLSKRERFDMLMRAQGVPDWQEIDTDPQFIEFLKEVPGPYTKKTKLDFLQEAARDLDADTVSKFFLDFKQLQNGNVAPPENRQEKMEKYIAPPKGNASKVPTGGQKQILTREAYNKFWKDSSKGRFNPSEWGGKTEQQVEDMLDQAVIKGELR
jgi:hypothetical protein